MAKNLDEQAQLAEVVHRLTSDYPTLSPAIVSEVVKDLHSRFNGARLREYIPMLVERNARTALSELSVSYEDMPKVSRAQIS